VTISRQGREQVEIVKGLTAGEQVVHPALAKQSPLKDGQRIRVK
jgi:hypothetical protein